MNKEISMDSSNEGREVMSAEELKAWAEYFAKTGLGDSLDIMEPNSYNKKEVVVEGTGPDDGSSL
jgi:hypothetical protein